MNELAVGELVGLAERINVAHRQAHRAMSEGLAYALEAGQLLLEAKAQLGHGEWLPWLAANVEVAERTAQAYMRLASRWPEVQAKSATVALLPMREALKLLTGPPGPTHGAVIDGLTEAERILLRDPTEAGGLEANRQRWEYRSIKERAIVEDRIERTSPEAAAFRAGVVADFKKWIKAGLVTGIALSDVKAWADVDALRATGRRALAGAARFEAWVFATVVADDA